MRFFPDRGVVIFQTAARKARKVPVSFGDIAQFWCVFGDALDWLTVRYGE